MPFTITPYDEKARFVIAPERLLRTKDDRLVPAGDPAGKWLFCGKGARIPIAEAEKYGVKELRPQETKEIRPQGTKRKRRG